MDMTSTRSDDPEVRLQRLHARIPPSPPPWMLRKLRALPVIVGLNIVVFLLWQASGFSEALQEFMVHNFLTSWPLLKAGHFWTLLSSEFSHYEWWHIGINMVVLWSFGSILERLLGIRRFLQFYLIAAVVASLAHCLGSVAINQPETQALGASGAVAGLLMLYSLIFPKQKLLIFGVIPIPAMVGALFFVGLDIWGLIAQSLGGGLPIGHGAHLGGALCGALYYFLFLRKNLVRQRNRPPTGLNLNEEEARFFDFIRNKLGNGGPDSLTEEERRFLDRVRQRVLRDD